MAPVKTKQLRKTKANAEDVADFFLAFANDTGETVTNLRLQKLVYYAQAWHLANYEKPLFEEDFEAWVHGPVVPALYRRYKEFGFKPIEKNVELEDVEKKFNKQTVSFLQEVADVYMQYTPYTLEQMTHREEPWIKARGSKGPAESCNVVISKKNMQDFYGAKVKNKG